MSKNILVITDKTEGLWINKVNGKDNDCHFNILTLGINSEVNLYVNKEKLVPIEFCKSIDIEPFAESCQEAVRKYIPPFINKFPQKEYISGTNLLRLLDMKNFNIWWFTEMSEKGGLRTPFIKRLYYLGLIKASLSHNKYDEIWLELHDKALNGLLVSNREKMPVLIDILKHRSSASALKSFAFWKRLFYNNIYKALFGNLIRYMLLALSGILRRKKAPNGSIVFFSFFPLFWIRSSGFGFIENFYRLAPSQIAKSAPIRYAVWLTFGNLFKLWSQRKTIAENIRQLDLILIESYLKPRDFLSSLGMAIKYTSRVLKYRFLLRPHIKEYYDGYDISEIVLEEIDNSLASQEIFRSILLMRAIRHLLCDNKISAMIYRIEFQPHERAIEYGVGADCLTIALQHQAIGRNHLQYFFSREEIEKNSGKRADLPLPDYIFVAGEYPYKVLEESGFKQEKVVICGPVRYASLVKYLKNGFNKTEIRRKHNYRDDLKILLIATPSVREEMLTLMLSLLPSLGDDMMNIHYLFKSHPVYKHEKEVADMIKKFCPQMKYSFLPDDIDLNDYLILSDALLLTGTTVGIEAICLGTVPILFEINSTFSLNPLLEIKDACLCVRDGQGLREAVRSIIYNNKDLQGLKKNWPAAIKKLFYRIDEDPNKRFVETIKNLGLI